MRVFGTLSFDPEARKWCVAAEPQVDLLAV